MRSMDFDNLMKNDKMVANISDFDSHYFKSTIKGSILQVNKSLGSNPTTGGAQNGNQSKITQVLTKKSAGVPTEYSARIINIMKDSIENDPESLILKPENIEMFRVETAKTVKSIFESRQLWEDVVEACKIENFDVEVSNSEENPQDECASGANSVISVIKITPKSADTSNPQPALIYANGEASISGNAGLYVPEACRLAVICNCTVFSVNCRNAPEFKCPVAQ